MKNINTIILSIACISSTATMAFGQATSSDETTPQKKGLGHDAKVVGSDMKKGTEGVFKDIGKGAKKVGGGFEKGGKSVVKGTETVGSDTKKGFSKLTHHKKATDTTTSTSTQ